MELKKIQITIKEATDKGKLIQIIDVNKNKYKLWKYTAQGANNPTFLNFQEFGKPGATILIESREEPSSFTNEQGKEIKYVDRTIYSLLPVNSPQPTVVPNKSQDSFGRRLAIHGFINARLSNGVMPADINLEELAQLEDRVDSFLQEDINNIPF